MACGPGNCKKWLLFLGMLMLFCMRQASAESPETNTSANADGLVLNFYQKTCPSAEMIARNTLQSAIRRDPTDAAALLRVSFHDCQVDGCDASVLLRSSPAQGIVEEGISDRNFGLRRLEVLDDIKAALEQVCPLTVSCADIIQMAARDAVFLSGGPFIPILTGRRDGITASNIRADKQLPSPDISVDDMISMFSQMKISLQDSVALLGAHTLGIGHCTNFKSRLTAEERIPMSPVMRTVLKMVCGVPAPLEKLAFAPNDLTNFVFDNQYFNDILQRRGLLFIDAALATDPRTVPVVQNFSKDALLFFQSFTAGFLQMSQFHVLTGNQGEIRKDCKFVNT